MQHPQVEFLPRALCVGASRGQCHRGSADLNCRSGSIRSASFCKVTKPGGCSAGSVKVSLRAAFAAPCVDQQHFTAPLSHRWWHWGRRSPNFSSSNCSQALANPALCACSHQITCRAKEFQEERVVSKSPMLQKLPSVWSKHQDTEDQVCVSGKKTSNCCTKQANQSFSQCFWFVSFQLLAGSLHSAQYESLTASRTLLCSAVIPLCPFTAAGEAAGYAG